MVTKDRLLFHVVTDAMLKEEKKKIKRMDGEEESAIALCRTKAASPLFPRNSLPRGPKIMLFPMTSLWMSPISVLFHRAQRDLRQLRWLAGPSDLGMAGSQPKAENEDR